MSCAFFCNLIHIFKLLGGEGEDSPKTPRFVATIVVAKWTPVVTIITEDGGWAYPRLIPRVRFGGEGRASFSPPTW